MKCDVAVIGAGVTGISAALALERRGLSVVVLERRAIAAGASGRNAGFLMRGAADNYAAAVRDLGRERAAFLWRLTERNLASLRQEGVAVLPSYQAVPSCLLALSPEEAAELRASADLLAADGFETHLVTQGNDPPWKSGHAQLGLINPHDAACNPDQLLALLASKLTRPPLTGQEVFACEDLEDRSAVELRCTDTTVVASHALVCTNAYSSLLFPDLANLIVPNRGQMLSVRVPAPTLHCSYYANHGGDYFRQPDPHTVVIGGKRKLQAHQERTTNDECSPDIQTALEDFATLMLGNRFPVTSRWAGTMGFTPDGLPLVGPMNPGSRICLCAGFTGHGMSMGYETAHLAVGALLDGADNPFPLNRFNPTQTA